MTAQIVPAQRFALQDVKFRLRAAQRYEDAKVLDSASYAESFPTSYTADAVAASEALFRTVADVSKLDDLDVILKAAEADMDRVRALQADKNWHQF